MKRRQTAPERWLIVAQPEDVNSPALKSLRRQSGVLVLCQLDRLRARRLRQVAGLRGFTVVVEQPGTAARVHDVRELRHALARRTPMLLISPIFETTSHPHWRPLPRMRAAALARLAHRQAIALGGMNAERYAKIALLGFTGWAGISAFRT